LGDAREVLVEKRRAPEDFALRRRALGRKLALELGFRLDVVLGLSDDQAESRSPNATNTTPR